MKLLTMTVAVALVAAAPLSVFAGRDQAQIIQQERANAKVAQERAEALAQARGQTREGRAAAGPAGRAPAAKEGPPSRQMELLKRFHPKHAYGY